MVTSTPIPPLPQAPSRSDGPAAFNLYADPFIAAMPPMVVQINIRLEWIATQVNAAEGYASSAASNAALAADAAESAMAIAGAIGSDLALPSYVGNARRPLAVQLNELGVGWSSHIKALYIEPLKVQSIAGATALDLSLSSVFSLTLTAAASISLTNIPTLSAAESLVILVRITQGATAYGFTWPAGIVWLAAGGVAPSAPKAGKRIEYILTIEGGTVYGRKGASN